MKVGTDGVLLGAWAGLPLETWPNGSHEEKKILDIGTGTGVIAMIMAQKFSSEKNQVAGNFRIDAIDIDEASCLQARENIAASKFDGKINVIHKPLHQFAGNAAGGSYDLVISNPPFFHHSLKSPDNARNMARHSDFSDLNPGMLAAFALKLLAQDGAICLILPKKEGENFIAEAEKTGLYCNRLTRVFPKPGKGCIRLLMQFQRYKKKPEETILTIETGRKSNDFSEEYKLLTGEFYLNF